MRKRFSLFELANNTILILVALLCTYPFLYVLFLSLSDGLAIASGQVAFWPVGATLEAYKAVLNDPTLPIFKGLFNSAVYAVLGTTVSLFATFMTAYVLTRRQIKGRLFITSLFVFTWVFEAGIIPNYIVNSALGFVDNPLVMIIPTAISTQFLIITKSALEAMPYELEEAAYIDGASDFQIMSRVYLPLCKTIIATVSMFYAVANWNSYLSPAIYLKNPDYTTIQLVLKKLVIASSEADTTFRTVQVNGHMLTPANLKAASIFLAMLPIVCVYPLVQKYFRKGILMGSVKG